MRRAKWRGVDWFRDWFIKVICQLVRREKKSWHEKQDFCRFKFYTSEKARSFTLVYAKLRFEKKKDAIFFFSFGKKYLIQIYQK